MYILISHSFVESILPIKNVPFVTKSQLLPNQTNNTVQELI